MLRIVRPHLGSPWPLRHCRRARTTRAPPGLKNTRESTNQGRHQPRSAPGGAHSKPCQLRCEEAVAHWPSFGKVELMVPYVTIPEVFWRLCHAPLASSKDPSWTVSSLVTNWPPLA